MGFKIFSVLVFPYRHASNYGSEIVKLFIDCNKEDHKLLQMKENFLVNISLIKKLLSAVYPSGDVSVHPFGWLRSCMIFTTKY